tara:strand:- start:74 stop:508 length:435 start_codon:yes stop_codon:yes gene_type:complete
VIYVDADACPVKTEIEQVATRLNVVVKMVCNGGIRPSKNPLIDLVVVDAGPDLADMWIANHAKTGDVVITTDIPLAAKVIQAGATVLKPNGERLTSINIGNALATRDLMYDLRAADPFRQSGGKGFSKNDRSRFLGALDQALRK